MVVHLIVCLDPQNGLGFRYPLLAFCSLVFIPFVVSAFLRFDTKFGWLLLGLVLPTWGLFVYGFRTTAFEGFTDTSYISFAIVFSLIVLLESRSVNSLFNKASIIAGTMFALLIVLVGIDYIVTGNVDRTQFFISNNIARIGLREYGVVTLPYIYFYASTFLILPLALLISEERTLIARLAFWIMLVSFFLSGTRSHNLLSIVFVFLYIKEYINNKLFLKYLVILISIVSLTGFIGNCGGVINEMISSDNESNESKLGMLQYYLFFLSDPVTFFIGQGFQAITWQNELSQIVVEGGSKTELTVLELFRVYGFFIGTFVLIFLVHAFMKIRGNENRYKGILLAALLFDSLLNPHLFSTYGAVLLASSLSTQTKL